MNSIHNFQSIRMTIFVTSVCSIVEKDPKVSPHEQTVDVPTKENITELMRDIRLSALVILQIHP
jgi:hypothetical protein